MKHIKFNNNIVSVKVATYICSNNRIAILIAYDNGYHNEITINLPYHKLLSKGQAFLQSNMRDRDLTKELYLLGIMKNNLGSVKRKRDYYDLVEFNLDVLKEYDSDGTYDYINERRGRYEL